MAPVRAQPVAAAKLESGNATFRQRPGEFRIPRIDAQYFALYARLITVDSSVSGIIVHIKGPNEALS